MDVGWVKLISGFSRAKACTRVHGLGPVVAGR